MPFAEMVLESFHMGLADGPTQIHKVAVARSLLGDHKASDGLFPTTHLPERRKEALVRYAEAIALTGGFLGPSDEIPQS
jgi:acyl-CoA dehydrogenase